MKIIKDGDVIKMFTQDPNAIGFRVNKNLVPFKEALEDGTKTATIGGEIEYCEIELAYAETETTEENQ